ncbi:hypothetical protein N7488_008448 [Penicillium malachiteum]|nr:hypothetical protein N7488_008448 [Penicillium malachiteum]
MSCWSILGHLLGKEVIQENTGKIVRAAEQYWKDHELQDCSLSGKIIYPVSHFECTYFGRSCDMHEPGCLKGIYGCDIYKNPWIIPKVQNAIKAAREFQFGQHRSYGASNCLNRLPPEILLCFTDILCPPNQCSEYDLQDIRKMLIAFSLCLPAHFWNVRFKFHLMRHLFFELDTLKDDSIVENQFLMLNLMRLLVDDDFFRRWGLANRERVLREIIGIIEVYSRNEQASGTKSVNTPMNELASV